MGKTIGFDSNLYTGYVTDGNHKYYQLEKTENIAKLSGSCFITMDQEIDGEPVRGKLYLSRAGYVFGDHPKGVTWLKFLGLGIGLPFVSVAYKTARAAKSLFGYSIPQKGIHDLSHTLSLAQHAWKAVVGWKGVPLQIRVEQMAIQELIYNGGTRNLSLPRSERFHKGLYVAKCMQPLFHKSQLHSRSAVNAARCDKYVQQNLLQQKPRLPWCRPNTVEWSCCGIPCFRAEQHCSCLYKVDCCLQRCYAIDCLCCFCCIWPEGRCAAICC